MPPHRPIRARGQVDIRLFRELSRRKLRTTLTIIGITIGIWALVVFGALANQINGLVSGGSEFFADKIPIVDSLWDMVHTAIRPIGGAFIAVTTLGDASPTAEALVALLGGSVAAGTHLTKTSTRAAVNASPEPFSNWLLSLGEDLFVVALGFLALKYPLAALVVAGILLVLIVVFAAVIIRTVRRWFARRVPR